MKCHARDDGYLQDFCDATLFQTHELFSAHPGSIQLIIYFDEVEICNPLGARRGVHKLGTHVVIHCISNHSFGILQDFSIMCLATFIRNSDLA